jgi:hypothetical protein
VSGLLRHYEHPKIGIILTLPRRPVFDQFRWSRQVTWSRQYLESLLGIGTELLLTGEDTSLSWPETCRFMQPPMVTLSLPAMEPSGVCFIFLFRILQFVRGSFNDV